MHISVIKVNIDQGPWGFLRNSHVKDWWSKCSAYKVEIILEQR